MKNFKKNKQKIFFINKSVYFCTCLKTISKNKIEIR